MFHGKTQTFLIIETRNTPKLTELIPYWTGSERTGPDRTGSERTGPDQTGSERTGPLSWFLLFISVFIGFADHDETDCLDRTRRFCLN